MKRVTWVRAIVVNRPGEAGGFGVVDIPEPWPAEGQMRIRMTGAAVNPADLHIIDGWAGSGSGPGRPLGLGMDVAGVVDAVGPGVHDFAVGTPVAALRFPDAPYATAGTAAEYVIVPAAHAAAVPSGLDLLQAATVPLNSLTAAQLLEPLGAPKGRRMLVTGAAGGVGGYATALAARDGWHVTAHARAADAEFLGRAGAVRAISDLDEAEGFDVVFDAGLLKAAVTRCIRDNGTYLSVFPGTEPLPPRGIINIGRVVTADGPHLAQLLALTARGELEARLAKAVPLEKADLAYQALRAGGQRGRWVLTP